MTTRFHYLREQYKSPKSEPVGCFLTLVDPDKSKVSYVVSVVHPKDKFNKQIARKIVNERHNLGYAEVLVGDFSKSHSIVRAVMNDIITKTGAFENEGSDVVSIRPQYSKKVRDAAISWLSFADNKGNKKCEACGSVCQEVVKE